MTPRALPVTVGERLVYEERNALPPHAWRLVASTVLDDDDTFGYLNAAGVRV